MKNSLLKLVILASVSLLALSACSMKCPFSGEEKPACGNCDESMCKDGKCPCGAECGHKKEGTAEKKSCH